MVMKLMVALPLAALLAGCASSSQTLSEPAVHQRLTVECRASNYKSSGCKTTHELAVIATLGRTNANAPSLDDLQVEDPDRSEF